MRDSGKGRGTDREADRGTDQPVEPTAAGADGATAYGVEAEIERLMRCPACSSSRVRQVHEGIGGGYGFFGLKAISDFGAEKPVECRNCGHQWSRPPLRELRREAERRIDERYAAVDVENERLRRQLADYVAYQRDVDRQLIVPQPPTWDGPVPPRIAD